MEQIWIIEIDEKYKLVQAITEEKISVKDIIDFAEWIQMMPYDIRQKEIRKISNILLLLLKNFSSWKEVRTDGVFCEQIEEIIRMIAVTQYAEGENDAYVECVRFLYHLTIAPTNGSSADISRKYLNFKDILPGIRDIFILEKFNGAKVFPIHEMVIGMARDFSYDNHHLVNLAVALQLFEKIGDYVELERKEEIRNELLQIAHEHNIVFLENIANGGELIWNDNDYQRNGTLLVVKGKTIIIRNVFKEFFIDYPQQDIKAEEGDLAWFVQIDLSPSEELVELKEYFLRGSQENKLNLIKYAEQEGIFNIFLPKRIVVDRTNLRIIRFLSSRNDKMIIMNKQEEENSRRGFLKMFRSPEAQMRSMLLCKDDLDILTVDFYSAFYLEVVSDKCKFYTDLETGRDTFYQGWLVKIFLQEVLSEYGIWECMEILEALYTFLIKYFDYEIFSPDSLMDGKLLGFPLLDGFEGVLKDYFVPERMIEQLLGDDSEKWCFKEADYLKQKGWCVEDKRFREADFLTLDMEKVIETGEHIPRERIHVFLNEKEGKLIYSREIQDCNRKVRKILEILDEQVICFNNKEIYSGYNLYQLIQLMKANNLNNEIFQYFQCDDNSKEIVLLYKALWHFQIYGMDRPQIEKFWRLLLEKHYLDATKEQPIKRYFEQMDEYAKKEGTLVVAKESSGNEATLWHMYQKYGHQSGTRSYLSWAFDAGMISGHLVEKEGIYYWRNSPLKKIIFMTDNMLSGTSTKKMLKYYLENIKRSKNNYLAFVPSIHEMREKIPTLEIEVHVIFGLEKKVKEIQEEFGVQMFLHNIIPDKYISDSETVCLVQDLYEDSKVKEGIGCIFRYNNLPFISVFPETVCNPQFRAGLFQRNGELE